MCVSFLVYFQLQSGICDVLFEKVHVLFVNKGRRKRKTLACKHTQHGSYNNKVESCPILGSEKYCGDCGLT
jgi:hypothetical protein